MEGMDGTKKSINKKDTELFLTNLFALGMSISTHFIMILDCLKNSEGNNLKIAYSFCKDIMISLGIDMPHITILINRYNRLK